MPRINLTPNDVATARPKLQLRISGSIEQVNDFANALSDSGFEFDEKMALYPNDKVEGSYHLYLNDLRVPTNDKP